MDNKTETQNTEPEECDNCGYPTALTEYEDYNYEARPVEKVKRKFCNVCSSTFLSRATSNPRQYGEQAALFQSLGYIANMILDEIRKGKK